MKEKIVKLQNIAKNILNKKGSLLFMGLIERHDIENRWDLLVSGEWVESGKSEDDLVYIIDELKREFEEDIDFISQIVTYKVTEPFIQHLAKTIKRANPVVGEKVELKFFADFAVLAYVIYHEFDSFEVTYVEKTRAPIGVSSF